MERPEEQDVLEFNEGVRLMKANQLDAAIEKFRAAACKGVDRPMEHYALALALYKRSEYGEARRELIRFLEMSTEDNEYVWKARQVLPEIEAKLAAEARPTEEKREKGLSDCEAYNRGLRGYMRGDYEAALEYLHAALQEFPDNKHIYNNLGVTCLAQKDYPKALGCFQKAIAIDPHFPEPRNNMGMAWLEYGAIQAREAFESLVETNPNFFDGLMNLAALCYREGDRPRARQLWQRAYALRPEDAQVKRNLGISD